MSEKPEAWTAIDSIIWPHLAAKLIREQHAEIKRLRGLLTETRAATWIVVQDNLLDRIDAALRREPGDG